MTSAARAAWASVVGTWCKLTEPAVFTHSVCGRRAILLHASHRVQVPEALQVRLAHSTRVLADKPRLRWTGIHTTFDDYPSCEERSFSHIFPAILDERAARLGN